MGVGSTRIYLTRSILRTAQLLCAIMGVAMVAAAFRGGQGNGDHYIRLGGHTPNFALVMNYSVLLYTVYVRIVIEYVDACRRLPLRTSIAMDGLMAVALFTAGIVLATSDYLTHCEVYGGMVACGTIEAATAFSFLGMFALLATLGVNVFLLKKGSNDMV